MAKPEWRLKFIKETDQAIADAQIIKLLDYLKKQAQVNEISEGFMITNLYLRELRDMKSQLEASDGK